MDLRQHAVRHDVPLKGSEVPLRGANAGSVMQRVDDQPAHRADRQAGGDSTNGNEKESGNGRRVFWRGAEPRTQRWGDVCGAPGGHEAGKDVRDNETEVIEVSCLGGHGCSVA